jgi:hypothetical protein
MEKIVFVHMDSIYYQLVVENAEKTKFIIQHKKPAALDAQFTKFGKPILVDAQQDITELTEYVNHVEQTKFMNLLLDFVELIVLMVKFGSVENVNVYLEAIS